MALNKKITQLPSHSDLATVTAMVGVYNGQNVQISGPDMITGIGGGITEVTGSSPLVVANGTTTPAISIAVANGTTNGYLSSVDWTTFNNKTSNAGTVTGVISTTTDQLTVTNGATNAELAIQTGAVAPGSNDLVTSGDIYTGVSGLVGSIDLQTVFDNGAPDAAYNGDVKIASSAGLGSDITLKDGSIEIAADDIKLQGAVNIGTVGTTASINNLGIDSNGNVVVGSTGGGGGGGGSLVPVKKSSDYTAVANDLVLVDTSATTNVVIKLPIPTTNGEIIGVKWIENTNLNDTPTVAGFNTATTIDGVDRSVATGTPLPLPSLYTYYEFIAYVNGGTKIWFIK